MYLKAQGGLELSIESFDPKPGVPYAVIVDDCDPVGAIEATHGLASELGMDLERVATCYHN